jgi:hypothetical protein
VEREVLEETLWREVLEEMLSLSLEDKKRAIASAAVALLEHHLTFKAFILSENLVPLNKTIYVHPQIS